MKVRQLRKERTRPKREKLSFALLWKYIRKDWQLYALLLPAVVYLFIFSYIPMYGVQIAFKDYKTRLGIWGSEWVGLKYFAKFINQPNFSMLIKNTLSISLLGLATFPCSILFAVMLDEVHNLKFKKLVQMVTYFPYFLSQVVVCSLITLFLNEKNGIINELIEFLGGTRAEWLTKPELFNDIYVLSGLWQGLGFGAIIYIAALSGVSKDLVEAARIDGATRLQIIRHVKLPHIMPTIVIQLIFCCGSVLSVGFDKVYLLQNALNLSKAQVISTYVYQIGVQGGQFSYASAIGLFNTIVNVLILIIVNKIAKKVSEVGIW